MNSVYKYKQKIFPKLACLVLLGLFAVALYQSGRFTETLITGIVLVLTQAVIHLHYFGKRLVIDDQGIKVMLLWRLPMLVAPWGKMVEASQYSGRTQGNPSNALQSIQPFAGVKWLASRRGSKIIKIIIADDDPLYIDLYALNASALTELIGRKIRFVSSPRK